ncbi:unnamed protein product, partial [Nesidiocoris tenuis]
MDWLMVCANCLDPVGFTQVHLPKAEELAPVNYPLDCPIGWRQIPGFIQKTTNWTRVTKSYSYCSSCETDSCRRKRPNNRFRRRGYGRLLANVCWKIQVYNRRAAAAIAVHSPIAKACGIYATLNTPTSAKCASRFSSIVFLYHAGRTHSGEFFKKNSIPATGECALSQIATIFIDLVALLPLPLADGEKKKSPKLSERILVIFPQNRHLLCTGVGPESFDGWHSDANVPTLAALLPMPASPYAGLSDDASLQSLVFRTPRSTILADSDIGISVQGRSRQPEISLQHTTSTSTSSSTPTPTPSTYPPWQMEQPFKNLAAQHGSERLLPIGNTGRTCTTYIHQWTRQLNRHAMRILTSNRATTEWAMTASLSAGLVPSASAWAALLTQLDLLFRRLSLQIQAATPLPLLRIMLSVLRVPGIASCKVRLITFFISLRYLRTYQLSAIPNPTFYFQSILDPFAKVLGYSVQNFVFKYQYLVDLCYLCNRAFSR